MKISRGDVEHVANLARLELSQEEMEALTRQLNDILTHMEKLGELDTEDVPPTYHVLDMVNLFRPDKVGKCLQQEEALANAPDQDQGCIRVPRVLEGS